MIWPPPGWTVFDAQSPGSEQCGEESREACRKLFVEAHDGDPSAALSDFEAWWTGGMPGLSP